MDGSVGRIAALHVGVRFQLWACRKHVLPVFTQPPGCSAVLLRPKHAARHGFLTPNYLCRLNRSVSLSSSEPVLPLLCFLGYVPNHRDSTWISWFEQDTGCRRITLDSLAVLYSGCYRGGTWWKGRSASRCDSESQSALATSRLVPSYWTHWTWHSTGRGCVTGKAPERKGTFQ